MYTLLRVLVARIFYEIRQVKRNHPVSSGVMILNKVLLFSSKSSNSTISNVEIFQMLRSIEFPLRFIRIDDHKLGILEYFRSYFLLLLFL